MKEFIFHIRYRLPLQHGKGEKIIGFDYSIYARTLSSAWKKVLRSRTLELKTIVAIQVIHEGE